MKITEIEIKGIIERGDMPSYICPNCDEVLSERIMGKRCPSCDCWTYGFQCRKRFYEIIKKLEGASK